MINMAPNLPVQLKISLFFEAKMYRYFELAHLYKIIVKIFVFERKVFWRQGDIETPELKKCVFSVDLLRSATLIYVQFWHMKTTTTTFMYKLQIWRLWLKTCIKLEAENIWQNLFLHVCMSFLTVEIFLCQIFIKI